MPSLDRGGQGGGGGGVQNELSGRVCWGSDNVPIMKDPLVKKKHTHTFFFHLYFCQGCLA